MTDKAGSALERCRQLHRSVRDAVAEAEVGDGQARRIDGFPYLRLNRFMAYVGQRFQARAAGQAFEAWVDRLRAIDAQATTIEIRNLPHALFRRLSGGQYAPDGGRRALARAVNACGDRLRAAGVASERQRHRLLAAAHVGDDYSDAARVVGLFPLTSLAMSAGWEKWKADHLATFREAPGELALQGDLIRYVPAGGGRALSAHAVRQIVERSRDRHLGIPEPRGRQRSRLIEAFAPIFEIDVNGTFDRIGHPAWDDGGSSIIVDVRRPTVFTRLTHTVVDGRILLQLNYAVWFAERPARGAFDLLAGTYVGLIWRVTLGSDGRAMIYDSVHACGCYHLLFVTPRSRRSLGDRLQPTLKEKPAVLALGVEPKPGQRLVLRLESATHYLAYVSVAADRAGQRNGVPYRLVHSDVLRSLARGRGRGRRSMFGADGLVAGSERLERVLLWPSGIRSPGAMRQWGRRATAFVDRRHFDDPDLFHQIFRR